MLVNHLDISMIRHLSSKVAPCCSFRRNYYSYAPEPFHPLPRNPVKATAEEAIKIVKSGIKSFLKYTYLSRTVLYSLISVYLL